ncbi:MAG TPA: hypothetical protein VFV32_04000 [Acidimicrobiales bacterium]|nr:hypothetical protein [Acidimicrobiales bacterium]
MPPDRRRHGYTTRRSTRPHLSGRSRRRPARRHGTITNSQTVNLGARQGAYLFNGTLDEVAIYPAALTAAQLAAHVSARTQTSSTITSIDTFDGAYRNAVIDDKASGYWRLGEPTLQSGGTDQRSAHPGSYRSRVTVGVTGAISGDTDTAASFDGTTKAVAPVADYTTFGNTSATIEAWFKTTASGPIFGYQSGSVDVTPTGWVPALYVGTDGKLRGALWPTPSRCCTSTSGHGAGRCATGSKSPTSRPPTSTLLSPNGWRRSSSARARPTWRRSPGSCSTCSRASSPRRRPRRV